MDPWTYINISPTGDKNIYMLTFFVRNFVILILLLENSRLLKQDMLWVKNSHLFSVTCEYAKLKKWTTFGSSKALNLKVLNISKI